MAFERTPDQHGNITRPDDFLQVVVWPGTLLAESDVGEFESWIKEELGAEVVFLECVTTLPDRNSYGSKVPGTGGRIDLLFAVRQRDITKFAVKRLAYGMSWIEDVLAKNSGLYESRVQKYHSWVKEPKEKVDEPPG